MEIEILFFVSLATEKIPDFKTLQVFAGSFLCCHAALANSHLQLCCLVDLVLETGKAASPF